LIALAQNAGMSLIHMALGFVMAHPVVTSAILGPRTMQHLDSGRCRLRVRRSDQEANYKPPAIFDAGLRRRPMSDRVAA
jgi:aryl-alcohol dehydrogenase-like predicted oxidoreductase